MTKYHESIGYSDDKARYENYYQILETNVISSYIWYKRNKPKAWFYFRFTGVVTILFSIIIPAVSAYDFNYKNYVIALMSLTIAIFSAINTFYRFGEKWQAFVRGELAILHLVGLWKVEIQRAMLQTQESLAEQMVIDATNRVLEEVGKIVSHETENYFSTVQWPKRTN